MRGQGESPHLIRRSLLCAHRSHFLLPWPGISPRRLACAADLTAFLAAFLAALSSSVSPCRAITWTGLQGRPCSVQHRGPEGMLSQAPQDELHAHQASSAQVLACLGWCALCG